MPWAWSLVLDCYDFGTGKLAHWPYPSKTWREQEWILDAIQYTARAFRLFSAEKWSSGANALYSNAVDYAATRPWNKDNL